MKQHDGRTAGGPDEDHVKIDVALVDHTTLEGETPSLEFLSVLHRVTCQIGPFIELAVIG